VFAEGRRADVQFGGGGDFNTVLPQEPVEELSTSANHLVIPLPVFHEKRVHSHKAASAHHGITTTFLLKTAVR
jgi:hypothetical protein